MNDQNYSDNLLDERHDQVIQRLDNIKEQVEETNGRVTKLERWRNRIVGAIAVITALIVPVLLEMLKLSL